MGERTWIKFYCKQWLKEMSAFDIEIRGVWAGLLAMAGNENYGPHGWIKAESFGYTNEQICRVISVKKSLFLRAKSQLLAAEMIKIGAENEIEIVNWGKYQSEYLRTKPYRNGENPQQSIDTKLTKIASESTTKSTENATPEIQEDATPKKQQNPSIYIKNKRYIEKEKSIKKEKFGEFQNVLLTTEEYQKLVNRFGEDATKAQIEACSQWMKSKGTQRKDHYATLLGFFARDKEKQSQQQSKANISIPKFERI